MRAHASEGDVAVVNDSDGGGRCSSTDTHSPQRMLFDRLTWLSFPHGSDWLRLSIEETFSCYPMLRKEEMTV